MIKHLSARFTYKSSLTTYIYNYNYIIYNKHIHI